jgi:hypothetical protein
MFDFLLIAKIGIGFELEAGEIAVKEEMLAPCEKPAGAKTAANTTNRPQRFMIGSMGASTKIRPT